METVGNEFELCLRQLTLTKKRPQDQGPDQETRYVSCERLARHERQQCDHCGHMDCLRHSKQARNGDSNTLVEEATSLVERMVDMQCSVR